MELRDHAQFDMQVLDGGKVIYEEPVNAEFMVLMTPGADRWLVRQLQATNGESLSGPLRHSVLLPSIQHEG